METLENLQKSAMIRQKSTSIQANFLQTVDLLLSSLKSYLPYAYVHSILSTLFDFGTPLKLNLFLPQLIFPGKF